MEYSAIKKFIEEENIQAIDLKYCDLVGRWYHITFPARRFDTVMRDGIPFDGSSIPGMRTVESGDMINMPDIKTAWLDTYSETPTLRMICTICDAETRVGVKKDPRSVAERTFKYMCDSGIADEAFFTPELEFYLFDEAEYVNNTFSSGYSFSSSQDKRSLPADFEDIDGVTQEHRKGYHMDTPFDRFYAVRQEMVEQIEDAGIDIRYHHHEVGLAGQHEIETELLAFPKIADDVMVMKDIIRHTALANNLSATLMPKPLHNEAGNGMHFHMLLKKAGENIFWKEGAAYADLSDEALWFIGGILKHGRSLTAFTNPSTNSFKRLLPGFEAPTKLFFGLANRSAAIRIPKYATTSETKRMEFRTGDATANPYLAMSALIMAGIDGIKNKINLVDHNFGPYDDNIFGWSQAKKDTLVSVPKSLEEALEALKEDNEYLLAGGVFNQDLLDSWISLKSKEVTAVKNRPHPFEMSLYYSL